MSRTIAHIDACLAALGQEGFAPVFTDFVETLGVDQIMVFSIGPEGREASCLLSRHFSHGALAGRLAADYLDGWFRQDPLLPVLMQIAPGEVHLRRLEDVKAGMSDDYRRIFFDQPGMTAKTTMLAAGERLRLFVSLYHARADATSGCEPDAARLVGRLALQHFERMTEAGYPPPLAALSERERTVCLGILSGQTAEEIAGALGVAPSTVVTYRKRAYAKLGVTARAGLFAICR